MPLPAAAAPIVAYPLVFHLGPVEITGFGIAVLLAFIVAQIIVETELARRGHDPSQVPNMLLAAVIGTLIGAKLYYVILKGGDVSAILSRGGFVYWGGFIGAVVTTAWWVQHKKLGFLRVADVAGIAVAAGYSVGRTGCWAVGDDYGRPWVSRWAVAFPQGAPPSTAENMRAMFHIHVPVGITPGTVLSVYPTQLFEVVLGFLMFLILWRYRNHRHAEGWLFGVYLLLAGVERFLIEFVRAKDDRIVGPLTTSQVAAIAITVAGALWMYWLRHPRPGRPGIHADRTAAEQPA